MDGLFLLTKASYFEWGALIRQDCGFHSSVMMC